MATPVESSLLLGEVILGSTNHDSYIVFIFEQHITQYNIVNRIIEELLLRDAKPVIIILDTVKLIHDSLQQIVMNLCAETNLINTLF